jgi:hypothetical protein
MVVLKYVVEREDLRVWIGIIWLRTPTSGGFDD